MSVLLENLETQVDQLLVCLERVKSENDALRTHLARYVQECSVLREKNQKAVAKVKQIIVQIKEELV